MPISMILRDFPKMQPTQFRPPILILFNNILQLIFVVHPVFEHIQYMAFKSFIRLIALVLFYNIKINLGLKEFDLLMAHNFKKYFKSLSLAKSSLFLALSCYVLSKKFNYFTFIRSLLGWQLF